MAAVAKQCRFCEFFDAEGKNPFELTDSYGGDCLNSRGYFFTPKASYQCPFFVQNSSLEQWSKKPCQG